VRRWFQDDWMRIEPKLRTSIVEGVSVFLSLFDDNPRVKHTFCPPKDTYDPASNPNGIHGLPLPPLADLIEQGKVIALNFPIAMNPGLARALGTMLKQDFQRAVLNRIHRVDEDPPGSQRPVFFVCDEYQAFATSGENEPSGDEKFFSLARQARCIPIVATQSISSLRSTLPGEAWRTLLQATVMSFELILPFLRPIAHLIQDPDVSEIMVNAGGRVFLERDGVLDQADGVHLEEKRSLSETSLGLLVTMCLRSSQSWTRVCPTAPASRR